MSHVMILFLCLVCIIIRTPPRYTLTDTLVPYTPLFRSRDGLLPPVRRPSRPGPPYRAPRHLAPRSHPRSPCLKAPRPTAVSLSGTAPFLADRLPRGNADPPARPWCRRVSVRPPRGLRAACPS